MDAQAKAIEEAEVAVKARGLELGKLEEALERETRRLEEVKAEADAAEARRRQADPFDQKAFFRARDDATLAAAKVETLTARVETARQTVEAAQRALADATFTRDRLKLERLQHGVVAERKRVADAVGKMAEDLAGELRRLHAATEEAKALHASIDGFNGAKVPALEDDALDRAVLLAADESPSRAPSPHEVLAEAASALDPPRTPPGPTAGEIEFREKVAANEQRRSDRMMQDALDRQREEAIAAEKRRARAAQAEPPRVLEPLPRAEEASPHDYQPRLD